MLPVKPNLRQEGGGSASIRFLGSNQLLSLKAFNLVTLSDTRYVVTPNIICKPSKLLLLLGPLKMLMCKWGLN